MNRIIPAGPFRGMGRKGNSWLPVWLPIALLVALLTSPPAAAEIHGLEVQGYKSDFGVSQQTAEKRLAVQQRGTGIVDRLEQTMGEHYAGVWFDNSTGEFVVPVVAGANLASVDSALGADNLTADSHTKPVQYSWEELEEAQHRLDKVLFPLVGANLMQTSLDPRTNAVVIRLSEDADKAKRAEIQSAIGDEDVKVEVRQTSPNRIKLGLTYCNTFGRVCGRPLRGGVGIAPNGYPPECSAGFKAIGNTYGNRFILTAGHCIKKYEVYKWRSEDADHEYKWEQIGLAEGVNFPGGDWAAIKANGSYWDTSPWPSEIAVWGKGEAEQHHPIEAESSSYMGEWVCHSGLTSGASCGNVTALNLTGEVGSGEFEYNLTEFGPVCVQPGDSGGPVFAGNTALGLLSGRVLPPPPCGEQFGLYVEITEATAALGVSVATQVGAPPVAQTYEVSEFPQPHQATGTGTVDPNGITSNFHFEYGTTTGYGSSTQLWGAGSGWQPGEVSGTISGLKGLTTYHYRIAAENSAGSSTGADEQFTTPDWRPMATPEAATSISTEAGTLHASINPQASETSYHFEYGKTTAYGTSIPVPDKGIGSGTAAVAVSQSISGLRPERTYHFRVVATNSEGTTYSADKTFTTKALPATFNSAFGTTGSGNGQLKRPLGIARDSSGNLWVVDAENNRVQKFNAKGEYQSQFGSKGSGNGQFNEPRDVAITPAGNLWVTDAGNGRIQEFNAKGEYLQQAGIKEGLVNEDKLVEPYGIAIDPSGGIFVTDPGHYSVVKFGESPNANEYTGHYLTESYGATYEVRGGSGTSEYAHPTGVTTDSAGNVWVADSANNRITKLYPEYGGLVYPVALTFGSQGSGEGQFSEPYGIAIKPSGNLIVVEKGNNRVQLFSPSGEYLSQFGAKGSGTGQFSEPRGIAIGSGGSEYITDTANNRVEKWSQPWEPEATTQAASNVKATEATLNGTVNPSGEATTYKFEYGKTTSYGTSVPVPSESVGSGFEEVAKSNVLTGLQSETTYHFRMVATSSEGTANGSDLTFTTLSVTPTYSSSFGSEGTGNGQFKHPAGSAIDSGGNLWVVDENNNRVQKFNEKGEYVTKFGSYGSGNGQLNRPTDLAIDAKGNIWVTDANNNRIEEFNSKGEYVTKFGSLGTGNGQFNGPESIAIDAKGNIWIADTYNGRLQKFNEKGEFIKVVSSKGSGAGQLGEPTGIDIGPGGNAWVADWQYNRVVEFNESGEYVRQFGAEGTGNGQFKRPDAIEVDTKGVVWVGDQNNSRVEAFNQSGEYITQFGSNGSGAGQFKFGYPMGIAANTKGDIWVSDTNNNRVQKWLIPNYLPAYSSSFGSEGSGNGQLQYPKGVAVDASGNVWVADTENNRIEEFNSKGEYITKFGTKGTANGQLEKPVDIAITSGGNLWVTDWENHRVQEFTPKGEFLAKFGAKGSGNGEFNEPWGIDIAPNGHIWVSDHQSDGVQEFTASGDFVRYVHGLSSPSGVVIDPEGHVWVADSGHNRVQELSSTGEFMTQFGSEGSGNGQFQLPQGIAIMPSGEILVSDRGAGRVEEFLPSGDYVTQFGKEGTGSGQFREPEVIAMGPDGSIYVADRINSRVQKWK